MCYSIYWLSVLQTQTPWLYGIYSHPFLFILSFNFKERFTPNTKIKSIATLTCAIYPFVLFLCQWPGLQITTVFRLSAFFRWHCDSESSTNNAFEMCLPSKICFTEDNSQIMWALSCWNCFLSSKLHHITTPKVVCLYSWSKGLYLRQHSM